jgi:hypothetical protein
MCGETEKVGGGGTVTVCSKEQAWSLLRKTGGTSTATVAVAVLTCL